MTERPEQILVEMEQFERAMLEEHDTNKRDEMYQEQDDRMEKFIESLGELSQDQFVRFMDLTREMSWDIPSALMAICPHEDPDEMFWMHRPAWRITEERQIEDEVDNSFWEPADKHFKEVHNLDLKDARINWSFDT